MPNYEEKIAALGFMLPPPAKPAGSYRPAVISGKLAFFSGQLSRRVAGELVTGKVGRDLDVQQGQAAAQVAALNLLAAIKDQIGWERFKQIVKITGFVQAHEGFHEISAVMNGASDLLGGVFGDRGVHARTSVGVASLPQNAAVEIDAIVELI